jgi:hypothetical protein
MQQLDGSCCGFGQGGLIAAASFGYGQGEPGSDTGAPRKHGVADRSGKSGRTAVCFSTAEGQFESALDPIASVHGSTSG